MRLCIIGAGAIGGMLAIRLTNSGTVIQPAARIV